MPLDAEQMADAVMAGIVAYVTRQLTPVIERLIALEQRTVAARDGRDGRDGEKGADGKDGADGADGLGFDDLAVEYDGERSFVVRFGQGERTREFPFVVPIMLDRGVYRDGTAYERGDAVTWAGSLWIAQEATGEKPDSGKGWRLAVKRGRDGKDKTNGN